MTRKNDEHTKDIQHAKNTASNKSTDVARKERAEVERYENLERDLTYAKSEIGTIAQKFLKGTPLPRRAAGIVLATVLSIGTGVGVGIYQSYYAPSSSSGAGVIEADTEKEADDANANNGDNEQGEDGTDTEKSTWEDSHANMTPATFTKGADGIYRSHIEAKKPQYRQAFGEEYIWEVPPELRKPTDAYVLHVHTQRRAEITTGAGGIVDIFYTQGGQQYVGTMVQIGGKDYDTTDSFVPFSLLNPYIDEELSVITLQSAGVNVDVELIPASKAAIRTWDGHSRLEQKKSELFRVTGPITATTLTGCGDDTTSANCNPHPGEIEVYGYRRGDATFAPLARISSYSSDGNVAELSGSDFVTGSQTLDGVELLWVKNRSDFHDTWIIE